LRNYTKIDLFTTIVLKKFLLDHTLTINSRFATGMVLSYMHHALIFIHA